MPGAGDEDGEEIWKDTFIYFYFLKFQVYSIISQHLYILQSDHSQK